MDEGCKELSDKLGKQSPFCSEGKTDKHTKNKTKSACPESSSGIGRDAFGRKLCPDKVQEKNNIECHESRKNFFDKDKPKEKLNEINSKTVKEANCEDVSKKRNVFKCKATSKNSCCSSSLKPATECDKTDVPKNKSGFCEHEGKHTVFSLKQVTPLEDTIIKMPQPKLFAMEPCIPQVEESTIASKPSCKLPKNFCPQLNKPLKAEFFCIDARNMKLNDCMKQSVKTNKVEIDTQCSELSRVKTTAVEASTSGMSRAGFVAPRHRQMFGRWVPTAGVYAAVAVAMTCWVTEWGAIARHLPFYRQPKEEETPQDTPTTSES
ncbi:uncharacterized protein LOC128993787 [Macrosteles quadrilineatus]|uniref:uncharacterized protein LOC128993787 n=1 Tax=Macrosteles quadrilineatus TaxID=74068 RepID=UPI0023E2CE58|nr:uncharacterized protein LOC128993787 [Macrosteles quadrilineatus]